MSTALRAGGGFTVQQITTWLYSYSKFLENFFASTVHICISPCDFEAFALQREVVSE